MLFMTPEREFSERISDLLMGHVMGLLFTAGGPEAQTGGRFRFKLSGDLDGAWSVDLGRGKVAIGKSANENGFDGTVDWRVSYDDVSAILAGGYSFEAAKKDERLVVAAAKPIGLRLMRALNTIAAVDLHEFLQDPRAHLAEQFAKDLGLDTGKAKPRKGKTRSVGVQLRKQR
jgi:hypothetical protein